MSEQIQKLETLFGMEEGSISKAVAGEDVSIDFDKVRSSADFETFKTNIDTEYSAKDEDRKEVYRKEGIEKAVKGIRGKKGWEFEGKTIDNLLVAQEKAIRSEYDGGVDKQVSALNGDVEGLRSTVESRELRIKELEDSLKGVEQKFIDKENTSILNIALDENYNRYKDKTIQDKSDLDIVFKAKVPTRVENGIIIPLNEKGEPIKDELSNIVSIDVVYDSFMSTRLKKPTGSNDDEGEGTPSGATTTQQVYDRMTKQGKSQTEIMNEVQRLSKEGLIK